MSNTVTGDYIEDLHMLFYIDEESAVWVLELAKEG